MILKDRKGEDVFFGYEFVIDANGWYTTRTRVREALQLTKTRPPDTYSRIPAVLDAYDEILTIFSHREFPGNTVQPTQPAWVRAHVTISDGRIGLGCRHFDKKNSKRIRKWAGVSE